MDLEVYNRTFEELEAYDEELDNRLRLVRQQCVTEFIQRLRDRQQEWNNLFNDILDKSQNIAPVDETSKASSNKDSLFLKPSPLCFPSNAQGSSSSNDKPTTPPKETSSSQVVPIEKPAEFKELQEKPIELKPQPKFEKPQAEKEFDDPLFSNSICIKEFIRIQELLQQSRSSCSDISTDPNCKHLKDKLTMFIRTQINSICVIEKDSDLQHVNTKIRLLTDLFTGQRVDFQDRPVYASQHPQGTIYAMDSAAQAFVSVGTRLVNSVPAIAISMATVINGIVDNNLPLFRELVIGYLQERCPYLIPMTPKIEDFSKDKDPEIKYKIACGYSYDSKTHTIESEEKYLVRMRSMVLLYGCVLTQKQVHIERAWSWMASFLSLKPEPVITALVLQAFLQEASKELSSTYGRQYRKMISFIKSHYTKMIEEVSNKGVDRQSLVKLKNLLADDSKLIAAPSLGSIFEPIRRF